MRDDSSTTCSQSISKTEENGCPWYINSPEHNNCLWAYIAAKSGPDGSMPELVQSEIAQLLGWSNTKTHFMLKQAMQELIDALHKHQANQLISNDTDQTMDFSTYNLDPVSSQTSEDDE